MKAEIVKQAQTGKGREQQLNILREELHHILLQETDRKEGFKHLCFVGGTALRILFGLDRFSEDLDFSITLQQKTTRFDFLKLIKALVLALQTYGFQVTLQRIKSKGAVHSCFFSFSELLPLLHRTFESSQKLMVKFEVDTNPPAGATEMLTPIMGRRLYKVRHYDLPSLFAGKLHAILFRKYTKGRDLYDFLWYIAKDIPVNTELLINAIFQTEHKEYSKNTIQKLLEEKFSHIDFEAAKVDVAPFVQADNLTLFERKVFLDSMSRLCFL